MTLKYTINPKYLTQKKTYFSKGTSLAIITGAVLVVATQLLVPVLVATPAALAPLTLSCEHSIHVIPNLPGGNWMDSRVLKYSRVVVSAVLSG